LWKKYTPLCSPAGGSPPTRFPNPWAKRPNLCRFCGNPGIPPLGLTPLLKCLGRPLLNPLFKTPLGSPEETLGPKFFGFKRPTIVPGNPNWGSRKVSGIPSSGVPEAPRATPLISRSFGKKFPLGVNPGIFRGSPISPEGPFFFFFWSPLHL